jgi:hypothetical protein
VTTSTNVKCLLILNGKSYLIHTRTHAARDNGGDVHQHDEKRFVVRRDEMDTGINVI